MTGYTVHTGTSDEFADGWDRIFSGSDSKTGKSAKKTRNKAAGSKAKSAAKAKAAPKKKKKAARKAKKKS